MIHTIDNSLISDELSKKMTLFAEMPANMPHDHPNLISTGKGILAVVALAYAGNKAIDYFKSTASDISADDPNKDIAWDYQIN